MHHTLWIARRERKETQADVGKLLLISGQAYHMKEAGKTQFSLKEALILAEHYGMTVEELFDSERRNLIGAKRHAAQW